MSPIISAKYAMNTKNMLKKKLSVCDRTSITETHEKLNSLIELSATAFEIARSFTLHFFSASDRFRVSTSQKMDTSGHVEHDLLTHIRATTPYGVRQKKVDTAQLRHTAYAF